MATELSMTSFGHPTLAWHGSKTETLTVNDTFAGTAFKEQESLITLTSANGLSVTVQPSSLTLGDDTVISILLWKR